MKNGASFTSKMLTCSVAVADPPVTVLTAVIDSEYDASISKSSWEAAVTSPVLEFIANAFPILPPVMEYAIVPSSSSTWIWVTGEPISAFSGMEIGSMSGKSIPFRTTIILILTRPLWQENSEF